MKITKLELKNFKRFDDLTIDLTALAEPAKLVLLIGTNGSGKSSVFDAFEFVNRCLKRDVKSEYKLAGTSYYERNQRKLHKINIEFDVGRLFTFNSSRSSVNLNKFPRSSFYGRTSIRQVPQLTRTFIGDNPISFESDSDRPIMFIERDNRFENDVENVMLSILDDVFKDENLSTESIKQRYINPINNAFENIFGAEQSVTIRLVSFKPPSNGRRAEILFKKGASKIPYDYLSGGEKEIFNIMLNLLARKKYFTDTIYFLDEIDLHLNTFLQKNLLKEITEKWIPDNCQLWTASHSLGFIEYANETPNAAIIDFDNLNFDVPQVIVPSQKNNFDIFEIAVSREFLANLFEDKRIIFSEHTDTALYNNLKLKGTVFFNGQNKADVFYKAKNNTGYCGLIDRDYLTEEERTGILNDYKSLYILEYYSIENYLFHPDNLEQFYKLAGKDFDKERYLSAIRTESRAVKVKLLMKVEKARESYPFYRENENALKLKAMRSGDNNEVFEQMFDDDDFEIFYKIFPAKAYGTKIKERQNLNPVSLAQTAWFKSKIEAVLTK